MLLKYRISWSKLEFLGLDQLISQQQVSNWSFKLQLVKLKCLGMKMSKNIRGIASFNEDPLVQQVMAGLGKWMVNLIKMN